MATVTTPMMMRIFPCLSHMQVEEFIMLTDPKLSLFTGMEEDISEADERPQHKITSFRCRLYHHNISLSLSAVLFLILIQI